MTENNTMGEARDSDFKLIPDYYGEPETLVDFIRSTRFVYELICKDGNIHKQNNHARLIIALLNKLKGDAKTSTYDKEFM
ncbi:hypothetical protein, partial [Klebsiella pneumoniae]|uniref:hypothetical protein n=1 Tax=Klebsiella pneumoniae TaxID=573 RepID=UPI0040559962